MKHFSFAFFALLCVLALTGFQGQSGQTKHNKMSGMKHEMGNMPKPVTSPDDVQWGPAPDALPAGAQLAVMSGNPMAKGDYTVRLKLPANYQIPPHFHPTLENVTVLNGTFHVGMGDTFNKEGALALQTGGFGSMPAKMHHFAWADGETIIQIHGMGPFAITYVNPQDDPRRGTTSKKQ